jgi:hypothetical protein
VRLAVLCGHATTPVGDQAAGRGKAFVDVNVWPMDTERVLPRQIVLVAGGLIAALGPSDEIKVPAGALYLGAVADIPDRMGDA